MILRHIYAVRYCAINMYNSKLLAFLSLYNRLLYRENLPCARSTLDEIQSRPRLR